MGFAKSVAQGGFRTESRLYDAGYGLVVQLDSALPRKYDSEILGAPDVKGFVMRGVVVSVLGHKTGFAPVVGDCVDVLLRPTDSRKAIYEDLEKIREDSKFFLEGVSGDAGLLQARWVHGAGSNRCVEAVEVVGPPYMSFQNPLPADGPRSGWLYLNLNGAETHFDVRGTDGVYTKRVLAFADVVSRLKLALEQGLKFRVGQRVVKPSLARLVDDHAGLEGALIEFRKAGYTACFVRSFVPGTTDASEVDVQMMSWPNDIPARDHVPAKSYPMPLLQETARFVALRDGAAPAVMEVVPGFVLNLVGNKDAEKSTKHKFAHAIVRTGMTEGQKNMYATQGYGPGVTIHAVQENGELTGITRLAVRTQGEQQRHLFNIVTPNFLEADKVKVAVDVVVNCDAQEVVAD